MGAVPDSTVTLISSPPTSYDASESIQFNLQNLHSAGVVIHATAGSFTSPGGSWSLLSGCSDTSVLRVEGSAPETIDITWIAPTSNANDVEITVITATGYGAGARRNVIVLSGSSTESTTSAPIVTSAPTPTPTPVSPSGNYAFHHNISELPGTLIEWTISGDEIELQLTAPTTGWVGFGISESGGMIGGDEFVASVDDTTGAVTSGDYHSTVQDGTAPILDDCDDWVVISGTQTTESTVIVVRRKLDTGDTQDWPILNETMSTRVMLAYGNTDDFGYHGNDQRATTKIDFYNEDLSPAIQIAAFDASSDVSSFTMLNGNFAVPEQRTCLKMFFSHSYSLTSSLTDFFCSHRYTLRNKVCKCPRESVSRNCISTYS